MSWRRPAARFASGFAAASKRGIRSWFFPKALRRRRPSSAASAWTLLMRQCKPPRSFILLEFEGHFIYFPWGEGPGRLEKQEFPWVKRFFRKSKTSANSSACGSKHEMPSPSCANDGAVQSAELKKGLESAILSDAKNLARIIHGFASAGRERARILSVPQRGRSCLVPSSPCLALRHSRSANKRSLGLRLSARLKVVPFRESGWHARHKARRYKSKTGGTNNTEGS